MANEKTTTNLDTLVINYLTQAQFDALTTKEANQIYLTPDNTAISLNGNIITSASFYAPTEAGTSGQYLKSNGSGAPSWANFPTLTGDENVKQAAVLSGSDTNNNKSFPIILGFSDTTGEITNYVNKTSTLKYNPYSKVLVNDGEIKAQTGTFTSLKTENLTANTATIVASLDIEGEMHTNNWTNASIANVEGSFYIAPTISNSATSVSINYSSSNYSITVTNSSGFFTSYTKTSDTTVNNLKTYYTRSASTPYTYTVVSSPTTNGLRNYYEMTVNLGVSWNLNSKVMITGSVTKGGVTYPLGTCTGKLTAISSSSFTISNISSTSSDIPGNSTTNGALAQIYNNVGHSDFTSEEIKISLYEIGVNSTYYPVGILLTSYGLNKSTYIDIYGGVNSKNSSTGVVNPNVRIGHLNNLPTVGGETPTGWGIYTDNGYFTGVIVANAGRIGSGNNAWTIGNDTDTGKAVIFTGIRGEEDSAYMSTGLGTEDIGGSGILTVNDDGYWAFTAGESFGVTTKGKLYADQAHIKGSIDATSFIARDGSNNAIATFNSEGISFGTSGAGITFNASNNSLEVRATSVYFGSLPADTLIEEVQGGLYYQYTPANSSVTYDVWYEEDEDKYYYLDSSGQKQLVNRANLDTDTDGELITIRRGGLNSQISTNQTDLQSYLERLVITENFNTDLERRVQENENWITNEGTSIVNWDSFNDSHESTLTSYFNKSFSSQFDQRLKGIVVDTTVPYIEVFAQSNETSAQSAVIVYSDKIAIKGEHNIAILDNQRFMVNTVVSSDIKPALLTFNEAAVTVDVIYSFALLGRSNHHLSVVKVLSGA